jgi:hypothetical protein
MTTIDDIFDDEEDRAQFVRPIPSRKADMVDKFVSPCLPPEGQTRELLTILGEECAEVIQRASKALRFGVEEAQPGQPYSNAERIGHELGDLVEVMDRLIDLGVIPADAIEHGRQNKRRQLAKFMQTQAAE